MNTSKQVNAMIGLMGLLLVILGGYFVYESTRQAHAQEHLDERNAERGARIFVNNCRSCHGMMGLGPEEGAIAPALNSPAFLILEEDNEYGAEPTAQGVADGIHDFLFDTIECGRTGTFMPTWGQDHGGPLSDTRIEQVVTLITHGRWDLVEEIGAEHDAETGETAEEILVTDASTLATTQENCGQYNAVTALPFRTREDPRTVTAAPDGETPGATAEPGATGEPGDGGATVQDVPVADFFQASCAPCHGADRAGIPGLGLPLTPDALTQPDEFYFNTIAEGRPGTVMPSWRANGLTDEEIQTLVEFITTVEP